MKKRADLNLDGLEEHEGVQEPDEASESSEEPCWEPDSDTSAGSEPDEASAPGAAADSAGSADSAGAAAGSVPPGAAGSAGAVVEVHHVASVSSTGEAAGGSAQSSDVMDTPMGRLKHVAEEGVQGLRQNYRDMAQQALHICGTGTHRFAFGNKVPLCGSNLKLGWQLNT